MQAAGGDVRAAAELAAGVQLGEDHLDAGQAGLGLLVDRDAAAVVVHLDRAVGVQGDLDAVRAPASASSTPLSMISHRQCIRPRVSVEPMYMPGPLADRLEALEDQEVVGVVGVVDRGASGGAGWHGSPGASVRLTNLLATRRSPPKPRLPGRGRPCGLPWRARHDADTIASPRLRFRGTAARGAHCTQVTSKTADRAGRRSTRVLRGVEHRRGRGSTAMMGCRVGRHVTRGNLAPAATLSRTPRKK